MPFIGVDRPGKSYNINVNIVAGKGSDILNTEKLILLIQYSGHVGPAANCLPDRRQSGLTA